MTPNEEIDMLRREIADLRDRVRALEARPNIPAQPYVPTYPVQPYIVGTPAIYGVGPATYGDPLRNLPIGTCISTSTGKTQMLHGLEA